MIRYTVCGLNTGGEYGEANATPSFSIEEKKKNHQKIWRGK
jgi:hypothetical protein